MNEWSITDPGVHRDKYSGVRDCLPFSLGEITRILEEKSLLFFCSSPREAKIVASSFLYANDWCISPPLTRTTKPNFTKQYSKNICYRTLILVHAHSWDATHYVHGSWHAWRNLFPEQSAEISKGGRGAAHISRTLEGDRAPLWRRPGAGMRDSAVVVKDESSLERGCDWNDDIVRFCSSSDSHTDRYLPCCTIQLSIYVYVRKWQYFWDWFAEAVPHF